VGAQVIKAVEVYGIECVPPDCPAARPPPCILSSIKTVDLNTMTTKRSKACDEFDEISPCTADGEQASSVHERNSSSTESDDFHLAQRLADGSAALDIQEEEDASLARRLAEDGDWVSLLNAAPCPRTCGLLFTRAITDDVTTISLSLSLSLCVCVCVCVYVSPPPPPPSLSLLTGAAGRIRSI
jgi:hypothetical protein